VSKETGIGWTDHTFNIAWGCMKVSPGCAHCYAETFSKRTGHDIWGPAETTARRTFGQKHWDEPLAWNRAAKKAGVRARVFTSSMADVFEDHPTIDAEREKLWPLIRATPWLDWQVLTKRPERIATNLPNDWGYGYDNVWLGTSIESQGYVGRLAELLRIPARIHFLSCEPLLGPLDLLTTLAEAAFVPDALTGTISNRAGFLEWVIVGGESGPGHREMPLNETLDFIATMLTIGCPVFVKQDSGPKPGKQGRIPDEHYVQQFPTTT